MTWYWWTHWFWITSTTGVLLEILSMTASVETYPLNPPFVTKEYSKKEKLLKFPLATQSDIDDVFIAGADPLSAVIRDSKILHSKDAENVSSVRISENALVERIAANESVKQNVPDVDRKSNHTIVEVNRTKGDVDSIVSSNSSFLSTISPVETVSNTSQSETSESEEEHATNTSTSHIIPDHSEFIDYDHNNSNESIEESFLNQTNSGAIDFIVDETKSPRHRRPHILENITKEEEVIRAQIERQLGERGRKSKVLAEYRHELKYINFSSDAKNLLARSAAVSLDFDEQDDGNVSSEALSIQRAYILDAGAISGICFAVLGLFCTFTLTGIMLYRRRYLNKPQTLSEPDSSAYIDDSTIRDNSDEMYSLDNDSFLNSLEAMTIQNYWTDTVKHTKL